MTPNTPEWTSTSPQQNVGCAPLPTNVAPKNEELQMQGGFWVDELVLMTAFTRDVALPLSAMQSTWIGQRKGISYRRQLHCRIWPNPIVAACTRKLCVLPHELDYCFSQEFFNCLSILHVWTHPVFYRQICVNLWLCPRLRSRVGVHQDIQSVSRCTKHAGQVWQSSKQIFLPWGAPQIAEGRGMANLHSINQRSTFF